MGSNISVFYALTKEQRSLIIPAVYEGLDNFTSDYSKLRKLKTDQNFYSRMRAAYVNTSITDAVDANPQLNMKAVEARSGYYYYTVITDLNRNINILVSNLPNKTYLFSPSRYRALFASYNIERMFADGFTHEQIGEKIDISGSQMSLLTESEFLPLGLVLCYDGRLGRDTRIFEGALQPSQEDWLFKVDVTNFKELSNNIMIINRPVGKQFKLELNKNAFITDDEVIPLKLK